jgi:hypothetical protein
MNSSDETVIIRPKKQSPLGITDKDNGVRSCSVQRTDN